jgi:hypothetical protein
VLATSDTTVATMANVAVGSYAITAKASIFTTSGAAMTHTTCTLIAGGTTLDTSTFALSPQNDTSHLTVVGTATFAATSSIVLTCRAESGVTDARMSRIVAVKVDTIQRDPVSG